MKAQEIRNMSEMELEEKLKENKTELFNLRFQHAAGQLENAHRVSLVKKDIARILTVMVERQYQETESSKKSTEKSKQVKAEKSSQESKVMSQEDKKPIKETKKTEETKTVNQDIKEVQKKKPQEEAKKEKKVE